MKAGEAADVEHLLRGRVQTEVRLMMSNHDLMIQTSHSLLSLLHKRVSLYKSTQQIRTLL